MKKLLLIASIILGIMTGCVAEKPTIPKSSYSSFSSTDKLTKIFTQATQDDIQKFYNALQYAHYFGIQSKQQEDMYISTVYAEVGATLVPTRENLNYSCSALYNMFSYYRSNGGYNEDGRCNGHSANQVNIGNKAYANRIGNGDVSSGDGYTFRGGGYSQTTGRSNYEIITNAINARIRATYKPEDLANNITRPYLASLAGMGYWYVSKAYTCSTMDCVTSKWNYYTDTYEKRNSIYQWVSGI